MDEKTLERNSTPYKKRNNTTYLVARTSCRRFARSVFGSSRRYC